MPAATYNLSLEQGATFRKVLTWSHGASVETATPYDLTGCTARMQIRTRKVNGTVLADLTTENGGLAVGADGTITIFISDTVTDAITVTKGAYDLEVAFPGGDVYRVVEGSVTIDPNVTRVG